MVMTIDGKGHATTLNLDQIRAMLRWAEKTGDDQIVLLFYPTSIGPMHYLYKHKEYWDIVGKSKDIFEEMKRPNYPEMPVPENLDDERGYCLADWANF